MENVRIYGDERRQLYLAYWYERLTRSLLHTKPISYSDWVEGKGLWHYDLECEPLRIYIEVKGANNNDIPKLFSDQLDSQLDELGFPIDDGIVLIFSYRNRTPRDGKGKRERLLRRKSGDSWKELSRFLAKNTLTAYAIDVKLLERLRKRNGTRYHSRDLLRNRHTIRVTRGEFHTIAQNARDELPRLGISSVCQWLPPQSRRIRLRRVVTKLDGHHVAFTLVPLLPNNLKTRLLKRLNGTVEKIA